MTAPPLSEGPDSPLVLQSILGDFKETLPCFLNLSFLVILFHFSGEVSPALPPKRKSIYASSPAESSSPSIPPPLPSRSSGGLPTTFAVNGSGAVDETKSERPAEHDNLPALPPKKSLSRMSAEVDLSPVSQVRNG